MVSNLILNGDFEKGTFYPFVAGNAEIVSTNSHSGIYSASLNGGISSSFLIQDISVSQNESYNFFISLAKMGGARSSPLLIRITYFNNSTLLEVGLEIIIPSDRLPSNNDNKWLEIYQTTDISPPLANRAILFIRKDKLEAQMYL
ncbi:NTTRR-F1 domain [Bacillus cereus]|uniref:NTTRR-F1 domain n=1 Tax=Bacillus cereus TaxID=1396 RepID=UPI003309042C|nr:NTTRR-F1 domain [Bacillus cereus]